jgi:hypothetical protein
MAAVGTALAAGVAVGVITTAVAGRRAGSDRRNRKKPT